MWLIHNFGSGPSLAVHGFSFKGLPRTVEPSSSQLPSALPATDLGGGDVERAGAAGARAEAGPDADLVRKGRGPPQS
jgi:hypothetical protein